MNEHSPVWPGGVVDLHIHGVEGFETRSADPDTMLRIAGIQGGAGVSAVLLSIYPGPARAMREQMAAVKTAMARQAPGSRARILGVHLEGPFLNPARCGALDPASFAEAREPVWRELIEGFEEIVRVVTIAPEKEGALGLVRVMAKGGIRVNMGHSDATYAEAEAGFRAGARGITHLFNGMRGFHHREPGIAGFGLLQREVYVEVIGDLVHLRREALELVFRTKDPGRILLVSDAVRATRVSKGTAPRGERGLLGGAMALPAVVEQLIDQDFEEEAVMKAATTNPRAYLES
jgi:N-acetylglucosamine-6-phosphate deacetylase